MYKAVVRECYTISHIINTSYTDLMNVTPTERRYMMEWLSEENNKRKEDLDEINQKIENMKNRDKKK